MTNDPIKSAFERIEGLLSQRDSVGKGTATTHVRLEESLTCHVRDGKWNFVADMSEKHGGSGQGPDPGVFGRTALGTCLAIAYRQWAAKLDIPLDAVEVEVQADYDSRGLYGVDENVSAGYSEIRYVVTVESSATEEDIHRLLDTADRHSPWLDDIRRPVPTKREVRIVAEAE